MGKRDTGWSCEKLKRCIREGRGQNELSEYKPWITVQDFPSQGRSTRVLGWKTQRIHHFFSDSQLKYFFLLDWEDSVIDIREHYPLLDLLSVIKSTEDLKLDKFRDKETKEPYIFTTTFLITLREPKGKEYFEARSIKYASELVKTSTLEKLEIERRYWKEKNIGWGIVTNKDINTTKAKNVEWIHSAATLSMNSDIAECSLPELGMALAYRVSNGAGSIKSTIRRYEEDYSLKAGEGILIYKHLLANKKLLMDMNKEIDINEDCSSVYLP